MSKTKHKKPRSDKPYTRERRLRLLAARLGFELVMPRCAKQRRIAGTGPCLLVPIGVGISLEEAEKFLNDKISAGAKLAPLAAVQGRCGISRETTPVFLSTGYAPEKDDRGDQGNTRH